MAHLPQGVGAPESGRVSSCGRVSWIFVGSSRSGCYRRFAQTRSSKHRSPTSRPATAGFVLGDSAGALRVTARHSAKPVSLWGIGSANGNRTQGLSVQLSSVESKWSCFQSGWYSAMVRNTATNSRRHDPVMTRSPKKPLSYAGGLQLLRAWW